MIVKIINNRQIILRRLNAGDIDSLSDYLHHLSLETVRRFGPHRFDKLTLIDLYQNSDKHIGYIVQDTETSEIIAYSIIKIGYLEHDSFRLLSYGLLPDPKTDCTFAPSVADDWQSMGIGKSLFNFILSDLRAIGIKRIILWGGVQSNNEKALKYYIRNSFRILGEFEYNGLNYDMILDLI